MPDRVAVVTDSTAGLPPELAARWGIRVIQIQLQVRGQIDDENRYDRAELIESLKSGAAVSTTPPEVGAFFWTYQDAVSAGATAIVSLHLSGKMSATVDAAREASQQIQIPVYVMDTGTANMSVGFAAISAARAAAAGAPAARVVTAAEYRYATSRELIYVDTLEYLRRGGRIGGAQALLGTAFSIKPLLTLANGEVSPLAKVAGTRRAVAKMVDLAVKQARGRMVDLAVSQFGEDEHVVWIANQLRKRLPQASEPLLVEASMVLGAHLGPGSLGITVSPVA
ncbi:DegV family protein [Amycolatopsis sp.]|jgi:DegV family protein with EDD domain|uniref:DegV family protein n=1 Tax=Amycolatopsis sp. TaxID=37632 RepID=UPI002DF91FD4|nr:DegV family protein [Amycolatopsis sp.]